MNHFFSQEKSIRFRAEIMLNDALFVWLTELNYHLKPMISLFYKPVDILHAATRDQNLTQEISRKILLITT